ncbi:MAG TPA: efflux RND transporter periplasmic adaptor subunit [Oxalicibacterium sp.]|uniref:efflux RND transporter periplasmic adaptor subunit n=1 Tax=Oxalicibacterium sp. TaxID=2766525 RepID=UPI002B58C883|nr:efflux RND transporter periplasmic adaptor subunit [Oxalicibacterium sp.]HWU98148.1 efflux RND transporter periplasmic adaptor subunit [Oxalicibacterium sp.]
MSENRHSSIGIHGLHAHEGARGFNRIRLLKRTQRVALLILGVLLVGGLIVMGLRFAKGSALAETSREQQMRYVSVISPKSSAEDSLMRLPGTLQGSIEAPIYARTSGYVTRWYKDIGDQVRQGDLLAQLDTPEVVQQLNEAKAAQAQAITNLQLAKSTFERWDALRKRDAVSQQDLDEKRNALAVAVAADTSAKATVQRLQDQLGYSRIVAPFAGVVTRRNIDIGNLVDAGGSSRILFTLAKSDPLRVYVFVPQNYAPQVKAGNKAEITLRELPGESFRGTIARTAGAIDPLTRTMQVEISLPNPDGKLLPGSYAQVGIKAAGGSQTALTVPSNTLLFRPEGLRVAVVGADGKVHLQPVTIGRELGVQVELSSGVTAADKLIVNPADSLNEGDMVSVEVDEADNARDAKPAAKQESAS